jgi:hypothetical protein
LPQGRRSTGSPPRERPGTAASRRAGLLHPCGRLRQRFRPVLPAVVVLTVLAAGRAGEAQPPQADAPAAEPEVTPVGPLDPLAQAVVNSLLFPERRRPEDLLEGAIRAADVEAVGVATAFLRRLADAVADAGEERMGLLADLGERFDDGSLDRLLRLVGPATPSDRAVALELVRGMLGAAGERRRDPARIAAAVEGLGAADFQTRSAAATRLASAGVDALPALLPLLEDRSDAGRIARALVASLGYEGVDIALGILGSPDIEGWPAAIEALRLLRPDADRVEPYLLAPALAADAPPAVRARAAGLLEDLTGAVPPRADAIDRLTTALDRVVSEGGSADANGPGMRGCSDEGEPVVLWDPADRRVARADLTLRQRRGIEATHLARDLAALGGPDPRSVRMVLLARLEVAARVAGPEQPVPQEAARAALTGAEGVDQTLVAEVLESAVERRLFDAAAAAADVLGSEADPFRGPAMDHSLHSALRCPDFDVRFAAARALIRRGSLPFKGASFVLETLLDAATARGIDRAVILHPVLEDGQRVAAEIAGLGYRTTRVATPRGAIVAARESCDTRLVVIAARSGTPAALETAEFVSRIPADEPIRVVVLVDPSDRGAERLAANLGPDETPPCIRSLCRCRSGGLCPPGPLWWLHEDLDLDPCGPVTVVDDIEGIFEAGALDGVPFGLPVFRLDEAGRAAARTEREARAARRLERAAEALDLLALIGEEGVDVSKALPLALDAANEPGLSGRAIAVLAIIGRASAQATLHAIVVRDGEPEGSRQAALEAFRESVSRFGTLLDTQTLLADVRRYNLRSVPEDERWLRAVLETVETPRRTARPVSDASQPR